MPSLPVVTEAFADSLPTITEPDVPASISATAIAIWPCPPYLPRLLPSWLHKSLVQSQFNFSVCSVHSCLLDRHHLTNLCQIQVHLWEKLLQSLPLHVQLLVHTSTVADAAVLWSVGSDLRAITVLVSSCL